MKEIKNKNYATIRIEDLKVAIDNGYRTVLNEKGEIIKFKRGTLVYEIKKNN